METTTWWIIGGAITLLILMVLAFIIRTLGEKRATPPNPEPGRASGPPAIPRPSRVRWGWLFVTIVVTVIAIGAGVSWWEEHTADSQKVLVDVWSLRWIESSGVSEQGNDRKTLHVEIAEKSKKVFRAILHDTNGQGKDMVVGGINLNWFGRDLKGTWSNYDDGDGGNCVLNKSSVGESWSGHWEHKDGTSTDLELVRRRKEVSKP